MKRRFSLVLAVVLAVALVAVIPFATGAFDQETQIGDVEEGYTPAGTAIHNADEFAKMEPNGSYYLARNIEISTTYAKDFTGTLDGNGKIVTTTVPLFKSLKGEVKNLKITGTVSVSDYDAGALAQRADNATVQNVLNHASVTGAKAVLSETYNFTNINNGEGLLSDTTKLPGAAGLVGSASGVCAFTDCLNLGNVNGSPAGGIVGIIGYSPNTSSFTFVNCHNEGNITDDGCSNENEPDIYGEDRGVAGIVGMAMDAKTIVIESCTNKGTINATYDDGVADGKASKTLAGGIFGGVGYADNTTFNNANLSIKDCTNEGAVKGSGQTGGIVGFAGKANFTIDNCKNTASASVESTASYAGGIAGRCGDYDNLITNCVNDSDNIVSSTAQSAGIVAYTNAALVTIKGCVNNGDITTTKAIRVSGIISGCVENAAIVIEDCKNTGDMTNAYNVGGIAGYFNTTKSTVTIRNCENTGNVTTTHATGKAGGMIADATDVTIIGCKNSGTISGALHVAGMAGKTEKSAYFEYCVNTGAINGNLTESKSKGAVAGIGGYMNVGATVKNCTNSGAVTCANANAVAGIIGNVNKDITIEGCTNSGVITGMNYVGGILGDARGETATITNCVNEKTGTINATASYAGGIVGYAGDQPKENDAVIYSVYATITGCENHADITTASSYAGGIVGKANHAIYDSVNTGNITAKGNYAGGIAGSSGASMAGKEIVVRCGNTGDVTADGNYASGMSAYVFGGTSTGKDESVYMYCYTTGNITAKTYVAGVIGYVNSGVVDTISYNYIGGTLTATDTDGITFAIGYFNNKASNKFKATLAHNYYVDGYAMYENYIPNQTSTAIVPTTTAEKVASGELAYTLNAAIKEADSTITTDVFYQTLGTDTHPVLDNTHKAVLKLEDGSYANELPAPPVEPEDTTTEEETTTETPSEEETTTVAPSEEETTTATPSEEETTTATPSEEETTTVAPSEEETTTVAPSEEETTAATPSEPEETTTATPFEPDGPIVGDSIATVIIVVAIAVVAIASTVAFIVIKKKEN